MKKSTRIIAAFVAALLTVALAIPSLAAPSPTPAGSITVMEPADGATYTAYQIFTVANDNGDLTYTAEDPWKTAIIEALEAGELAGLQIADDGTVTKLPYFKAADFAAWAMENIPTGATEITLAEDADGKMTTGPIDPGYYLVVPDPGEVASLCTVLDTEIAIQDKNDMPFEKEVELENGDWGKESGVNVGDTLNFRITGKVPTLDADQASYFYLVNDYLTSGLDLVPNSVVVTIGDQTITLDPIYDPEAELTGNQIRYNYVDENDPATPDDPSDDRLCGFDLSIDMIAMNEEGLAGEDVIITYSATVNENAIAVISENNAGLDYGDENTQHHKDSMTKHYTSTIIIDKFETGSPESKVPGAKFVLMNEDGKYYSKDANNAVIWVDDVADAYVAVTDAEGAAEFGGLADGTYSLVEVEAPAGYTMLTEPIEVVVDGSDATAIGLNESELFLALSEFVRVSNTPGTNLPSTGGIGTYIFYILGGVLVVAAAVVIVMLSSERRKS
ncbi:MAG: SpaH/EbpB family LPXTG-anchored major pilin [Clostridia bacterium]|nr:SpaH/EbpB family LPXTG-anchored major pilin [Clostridia bacterium]